MKVTILALVVLTSLVPQSYGRTVKKWTPAELSAGANTVVILEALSTRKTDILFPHADKTGQPQENFQAWITTCKVHAAFKGDLIPEKIIEILHYKYSEKFTTANNGADFAELTIGPVKQDIKITHDGNGRASSSRYKYFPVWLSFLKKRTDGLYEPFTDQYESAQSFKELYDTKLH